MWPTWRLAGLSGPRHVSLEIPSPARSIREPVPEPVPEPDPAAAREPVPEAEASSPAPSPLAPSPPAPAESDISLPGARVEIRALWARIHELELQMHLVVHAFDEVITALRIHG